MRSLLVVVALAVPLLAFASCTTFETDAPTTADGGGGDGDPTTGDGGTDGAPSDPEIIASGLGGVVSDIATTGTEVIFMTTPGGIFACPIAGCGSEAPRAIAKVQKPRFLITFNGNAYWSDEEVGEVRGAPVAGGASFVVLAKVAATGLAASPTDLWIGSGADVIACGLTMGGPCQVPVGVATSVAIASDGAHIYYLNKDGEIGSIDAKTRERDAVTMAQVARPVDVFAEAGYLYLLRADGIAVRYQQGVALPPGGPSPPTIVTGLVPAGRLTVVAGAVYATGGGSKDGRIVAAPVVSGAERIVTGSLDQPTAIAARDEWLYVGVARAIKRVKR